MVLRVKCEYCVREVIIYIVYVCVMLIVIFFLFIKSMMNLEKKKFYKEFFDFEGK